MVIDGMKIEHLIGYYSFDFYEENTLFVALFESLLLLKKSTFSHSNFIAFQNLVVLENTKSTFSICPIFSP